MTHYFSKRKESETLLTRTKTKMAVEIWYRSHTGISLCMAILGIRRLPYLQKSLSNTIKLPNLPLRLPIVSQMTWKEALHHKYSNSCGLAIVTAGLIGFAYSNFLFVKHPTMWMEHWICNWKLWYYYILKWVSFLLLFWPYNITRYLIPCLILADIWSLEWYGNNIEKIQEIFEKN